MYVYTNFSFQNANESQSPDVHRLNKGKLFMQRRQRDDINPRTRVSRSLCVCIRDTTQNNFTLAFPSSAQGQNSLSLSSSLVIAKKIYTPRKRMSAKQGLNFAAENTLTLLSSVGRLGSNSQVSLKAVKLGFGTTAARAPCTRGVERQRLLSSAATTISFLILIYISSLGCVRALENPFESFYVGGRLCAELTENLKRDEPLLFAIASSASILDTVFMCSR